MRDIDEKAIAAKTNDVNLEKFIAENEAFIISISSKVTGTFITKTSEQWSIALSSFCEAINSYSYEKGSFYSFAELVLKRRLIDFARSKNKLKNEISVNPFDFECDANDDFDGRQISYAEVANLSYTPDNSIKLEIEAITQVIKLYGITFFELIGVSPKAEKTKKACAVAIANVIKNPELLIELREKKTLPIKKIKNITNLPPKILERHRKYIITGVEIISGDYPYLSEYLKFIREEL